VSEHSQSLASRRAALQLQCALQREEFALQASHLREGLNTANRGIDVVRGLRIMPMIMAATSAAGLISRASGVVRLLGRAWFIISTLRRLRKSPSREAAREPLGSDRRPARRPASRPPRR
jgi:YqjK-like protein